MGPIHWPAVALAALAGSLVLIAFERRASAVRFVVVLLLTAVSAAMLGHALARIGPATLALKPKLYFMQSGGLAAAFVIPALWIAAGSGKGAGKRTALASLAFLAAYLVMGAVFWLVG